MSRKQNLIQYRHIAVVTIRLVLGISLIGLLRPFSDNLSADDRITIAAIPGKLQVEINGKLFTEYRYRDYAKPIFYPLLGIDDVPMTRNYPMAASFPGERKDHPHHKSLWFTHGDVNGVNFWAEGDNCGRVVQLQILHESSGQSTATLATENAWIDANKKTICTDTREYWFSSLSEGRVIDMRITLRATHGDVAFKDTKEGAFGIRTHPNLQLDRDSEESTTGQAINSAGHKNRDVWGKRAAWVDYYGEIDGKTVGIAMFDHPSNPRYPTWWHARDYGLVAANPFGKHDFERSVDVAAGDLMIQNGDSVTFLYRVLLHGEDTDHSKVRRCYEKFSTEEPAPIVDAHLLSKRYE